MVGQGGVEHVLQFVLVRRRHHHQVGNEAQEGEVEHAVVGRAVVTDHAAAVQGDGHRQVGQADVVDELVQGPLHERGIDREEGAQPLQGEPGGKGDGVLLGDTHIEKAVRKLGRKGQQAGAAGHGRGDRHHPLVGPGQPAEGVAEHPGVGQAAADALHRRAGGHVKGPDPVELAGVGLGRLVALALGGDHVHQHRAVRIVAHVFQGGDQVVQFVAGNRADILELERLEEHARGEQVLQVFLTLAQHGEDVLAHRGQGHEPVLDVVAQPADGAAGHLAAEEAGQGADIFRDRHLVVIEDDDQVPVEVAGVVETLEGHARGHRAVADDGDDFARLPLDRLGRGHAQAVADGGGTVAGPHRVVLALRPLGEAAQPPVLAQGGEPVLAAGEQFVGVGLVAHIPDQPVTGRVEHVVQGQGEFDHAEAGRQVAAGPGHGGDDGLAEFTGELFHLRHAEVAQVGGGVDGVQQPVLPLGVGIDDEHDYFLRSTM